MRNFVTYLAKKIVSIVTFFSPKEASKIIYRIHTHKKLNLKNPELFNEKLMYIKLQQYDNNPLIIRCSDKVQLPEYLKEKGYNNLTSKIIKIYDDANKIDFDELPNRFALKCNHGCKFNIIVRDKDKLDIVKTRRILNRWMKKKYGYATVETHYFNIKPCIFAEEFIDDGSDGFPKDYKVYVFNGKAKCVLVCANRERKLEQKMYDLDWKELNYLKESVKSKNDIAKPYHFDEMIRISEDLAKPFDFVRVDFYDTMDKLILGELTFTPARCSDEDYNDYGDRELGKMLMINEKK